MNSYVMQAPASNKSDDKAVWAIIALIAVVVAGGAGWFIARQDAPMGGDIEQATMLANRSAELNGRNDGFAAGQTLGRKEARLQGQLSALTESRGAYSEGWNSGLDQGRTQAQATGGYDEFGDLGYYPAGATSSGDSWDNALLQLDDAPGYGAPAYGGSGYDTSIYRNYSSANGADSGLGGGSYSDLYRGGRPEGY